MSGKVWRVHFCTISEPPSVPQKVELIFRDSNPSVGHRDFNLYICVNCQNPTVTRTVPAARYSVSTDCILKYVSTRSTKFELSTGHGIAGA
eukprot:12862-Rhodomonas_salina.2